MGDKILKSLQFPGSTNRYKIPQSDYAQTDSTQPDYIKNKLVGKEVTYSDTLTWDGNTDGLENMLQLQMQGYKVSDNTPTLEEIRSGYVTIKNGDNENTVSMDDVSDKGGLYVAAMSSVYIVVMDNAPVSKGIYLQNTGNIYVSSITVPNYQFPTTTTKKLTAEYLEPFEVVTKGGDTLTWDGDTSGKTVVDLSDTIGKTYVKVSDATPTEDEFSNGATGNIVLIGEAPLNIEMSLTGGGYFGGGLFILVVPTDNYSVEVDEELAFTAEEKGVYFAAGDAYVSSLTIPNYTGFPTTEKKLKGEYLIDTNSIILKSSDGKRFKITVSDTGTLTATEI